MNKKQNIYVFVDDKDGHIELYTDLKVAKERVRMRLNKEYPDGREAEIVLEMFKLNPNSGYADGGSRRNIRKTEELFFEWDELHVDRAYCHLFKYEKKLNPNNLSILHIKYEVLTLTNDKMEISKNYHKDDYTSIHHDVKIYTAEDLKKDKSEVR